MNKEKIVMSITIGVVCILLISVMFAQFKTVEETDITGIETAREEELREMLANWKSKYEEASQKVEETRVKIEEYKNKAVSVEETNNLLDEELLQTNKLIGKTDVIGEGVIINLEDNENTQIEDTDLLKLVNELKLAGAEAISINDKRIVNMSEIVKVDETILINTQRVTSPYVVKAIGDKKYFESALTIKGGYIDEITGSGKDIEYNVQDNIVVPAYEG